MRRDAVARWRAWTVVVLMLVAAAAQAQEAADDPSAPPASPTLGTFSGVVRDQAGGVPLADAKVEVIGRSGTVQTGPDGTFSMRLEPGTYTVRITAPGRLSRTIPKLVVPEDKPAKVEVRLAVAPKPDPDSLIVNVIARLRRAAESAQLARRKGAATVSETISSETMKKSTGSDATAAVSRATAVTIRESGGGSKTVFVRGLGERYTSALLNGSRLPSPDALRRAVPLDLFPADFLEGIDIVKGYTPDLPGDFSGGLIDMRLRDFPDRLTYSVGVSTGGNTSTTGQPFLSYDQGGAGDYFTMGESDRNWPGALPAFDVDELAARARFALARSFKDIWSPEKTQQAPVDWGANFSVGNTIGPFGFQLGGVYNVKWRTIEDAIVRQFTNAGTIEKPDIIVRDDFRTSRGQQLTRLGGVFTGSWRINADSELNLRSFVNRSSVDEARADTGVDFQQNFVQQSRLRYVEDELAFGQLAGSHKFDFVLVDWRTVLARTTRDEPDTRHISYIRPEADPSAPLRFDDQQLGGTRIANETREDLTDSALDFTIPFETALPGTGVWSGLLGKFKLGPAYSFRDRTFQQRRIEFVPDPSGVDTTLPPDEVLQPSNVGPGGVDITETTLPTDKFKGTHEIIAGYGMLELPLVKDRLRLVGGARVEYSLIRVNTNVFSQELCGDDAICAAIFRQKSLDVLPGVNLIFNPLKDMNVRLAWSQSVSRPELRELAPADFPAQRGERASIGNPDLQQFGITSYDARWEWFYSPLEVVSAGFFYKELDQPIERFTLLRGTDPIDTFANSQSATILGVEFELRKDFGFIRPMLKNLSATFNFTWTDSNVEVGRPLIFGTRSFPTSQERQVIGQAPFIVNAAIEYADPDLVTARLAYLTVDAAIEYAGTQGVPDIIEQRRDLLDFVLLVPLKRWLDQPISVKITAENLLNDQRIYTVGDVIQRRWIDGVTFGLGISYSQ
jgi:hypothetical protein